MFDLKKEKNSQILLYTFIDEIPYVVLLQDDGGSTGHLFHLFQLREDGSKENFRGLELFFQRIMLLSDRNSRSLPYLKDIVEINKRYRESETKDNPLNQLCSFDFKFEEKCYLQKNQDKAVIVLMRYPIGLKIKDIENKTFSFQEMIYLLSDQDTHREYIYDDPIPDNTCFPYGKILFVSIDDLKIEERKQSGKVINYNGYFIKNGMVDLIDYFKKEFKNLVKQPETKQEIVPRNTSPKSPENQGSVQGSKSPVSSLFFSAVDGLRRSFSSSPPPAELPRVDK